MKWASSISEASVLSDAVEEAVGAIDEELEGRSPQLLVAFASNAHRGSYDDLAARLAREFPDALVLGCSARSVIGGGRELEERPGLSLNAGQLPGVSLHPFRLDSEALRGTPDPLGVPRDGRPHFVLLADPFSTETERLVQELDASFPESVKIGGLASGGEQPGENALFLAGAVHRGGVVGVALEGDVEVDAIVAQGCRPIGAPMFVTRCRENLLLELDGRSPVTATQELYESLGPEDQALVRRSLFIGIVMRDDQVEYSQGDFLIRNLVGIDEESGAISVAARLHDSQVVQFHVRDARTSAEDLEQCLSRYTSVRRPSGPEGALLFSCLGRGQYLYGVPDHDSNAFRRHLGDVPLGGFFCNGEIGPVQNHTYLHGYTSSFGLFRSGAR